MRAPEQGAQSQRAAFYDDRVGLTGRLLRALGSQRSDESQGEQYHGRLS